MIKKKSPLDELFEGKTDEEIDQMLDEAIAKIPKHTDRCHTMIVGGVRPSCPGHPDFHRGPRKVWHCSDDCPIKGKDY